MTDINEKIEIFTPTKTTVIYQNRTAQVKELSEVGTTTPVEADYRIVYSEYELAN